MDVAGSEIGQKMRSAIKAKLTELGCYVDDELPDYVMVMVANKRTRAQMEDDLQLFLGDNTELFVNWLHQVLKKLQEVTVTTPLKVAEAEKSKERSTSKERKAKEKKEKTKKKTDMKKAKKKEKEKHQRKKEEKKAHKNKKKSKSHESIRPNIPPLLMNIEKESEPSITDVFAGQILKSHGITIENIKVDKPIDKKPILQEAKRPILPIIDPATITSQPDPDLVPSNSENTVDSQDSVKIVDVASEEAKQDQIKEIDEIEAKIQGLKQKLAEQLDSMSEDEDFLNIRTEAEELMNDFAEDVFQEISEQAPKEASPIQRKTPSSPKERAYKPVETPTETLPQIELNLPKRAVRERLGARAEPRKLPEVTDKKIQELIDSPERFTPEPLPEYLLQTKSAKSFQSNPPEKNVSDDSLERSESSMKRLTSNVSRVSSALESRARSCASVVRVRPRPRGPAPASSLLLRAVADAHKSLLNVPPKMDPEPQVKRALVLPMRRVGEPKIVIQVPADRAQTDSPSDNISLDMDSEEDKRIFGDMARDEYVPTSITMKIKNTDYVPSKRNPVRTASRRDDSLIIETINIHNPTVDKDKNTQFIVTMDGFNPNSFLAKKLKTEGLIDDEGEIASKPREAQKDMVPKTKEDEPKKSKQKVVSPERVSERRQSKDIMTPEKEKSNEKVTPEKVSEPRKSKDKVTIETDPQPKKSHKKVTPERVSPEIIVEEKSPESDIAPQKKRVSNDSSESDTQVVIKQEVIDLEENNTNKVMKDRISREDNIAEKRKSEADSKEGENPEPVKRRKASPIVFDVGKKEKEKEKELVKERERTESASSDNHVIVTATNSHKYDSLPSLSQAERSLRSNAAYLRPCRAFPLCRYGAACAFSHPRCKFAAACSRRGCVYDHPPGVPGATAPPLISSHVVPVANYKSITAPAPAMCKFYPSCVNPSCAYFHPKPCRYGTACLNKLECNFYHADANSKYRYPV